MAIQFGTFVPQGWRLDLMEIADPVEKYEAMTRVAKAADALPIYDSIWVYDHFHTTPRIEHETVFEAWTITAALARDTRRVKVGQMVTCIGYRNPALAAKIASTVDVLSHGRLYCGIGAGWYEHEWRAYGYGFPRAGERIAALDEGVQIMKQAWETGEATLDGTYYQVSGTRVYPRPLQSPRIPLWIAGGGEKKTLRIVARLGDYANLSGDPEGFAHKSSVLEGHCRDVGRDFAEITRSANYNVFIGETEADVADRLAWAEDRYRRLVPERADGEVAGLRSGPLVGTPEQIVDKLVELRALGMTYAITYFADAAYDRSSIELFEREVAPALR